MATEADVRRLALALPDSAEATDDFAFVVMAHDESRRFAWCWKERIHPKKARVPNKSVLVVRVANTVDKDLMMRAEPDKFVVDPHYDGYAAIIFPLAKVRVPELRALLTESHRVTSSAPRRKRR